MSFWGFVIACAAVVLMTWAFKWIALIALYVVVVFLRLIGDIYDAIRETYIRLRG